MNSKYKSDVKNYNNVLAYGHILSYFNNSLMKTYQFKNKLEEKIAERKSIKNAKKNIKKNIIVFNDRVNFLMDELIRLKSLSNEENMYIMSDIINQIMTYHSELYSIDKKRDKLIDSIMEYEKAYDNINYEMTSLLELLYYKVLEISKILENTKNI